MYRHCIFCSRELGRNESIEEFPVGSRLAFDAARGRLWAVCPGCGRWNLAPLEERWEAVESAERRFVDSRLRVHSENIGLAKLRDGTRLIRVGDALAGELAAWRYGDQIVRRRWRTWFGVGAAGIGGAALIVGGLPLAAAAGGPAVAASYLLQAAGNFLIIRNQYRAVLTLGREESTMGSERVVRMHQARYTRVIPGTATSPLAVEMPAGLPPQREETGGVVRWVQPPPLRLEGDRARRLLERTLVGANAWGLGAGRVERAVDRLAETGGAEAFLARIGEQRAGIFPKWAMQQNTGVFDPRGTLRRVAGTFRGERIAGYPLPNAMPSLDRVDALALEMALHEESEREALRGELLALESAWREAEEIAAIADALPDDPLDRLRGREHAVE